ncbi:MAG TPA: 3-hydroxyacyl-ACP dehydratase FabZ family protein [Pirellulaceae bacterium]|nr:3-hydroxyacyl-ACP dehydratase FabZ family protein [Pirellulaceae bacterium]
MSQDAIRDAIPHRPPMLLVDEIVEQTDSTIVCRKTFGEEEFFFQGHYPDQPIVPGVILCEASMQAGAILLSQFFKQGDGVPVVTRLNDVKFKRMVQPGKTVDLDVTLNERLANAFFLTGKVKCEGKLAVRLDFACTMTSPNE